MTSGSKPKDKDTRNIFGSRSGPSALLTRTPGAPSGVASQRESPNQRSGATSRARAGAAKSTRSAAAPETCRPPDFAVSRSRPPMPRGPFPPKRTQSEKTGLRGLDQPRRVTQSASWGCILHSNGRVNPPGRSSVPNAPSLPATGNRRIGDRRLRPIERRAAGPREPLQYQDHIERG